MEISRWTNAIDDAYVYMPNIYWQWVRSTFLQIDVGLIHIHKRSIYIYVDLDCKSFDSWTNKRHVRQLRRTRRRKKKKVKFNSGTTCLTYRTEYRLFKLWPNETDEIYTFCLWSDRHLLLSISEAIIELICIDWTDKIFFSFWCVQSFKSNRRSTAVDRHTDRCETTQTDKQTKRERTELAHLFSDRSCAFIVFTWPSLVLFFRSQRSFLVRIDTREKQKKRWTVQLHNGPTHNPCVQFHILANTRERKREKHRRVPSSLIFHRNNLCGKRVHMQECTTFHSRSSNLFSNTRRRRSRRRKQKTTSKSIRSRIR
jgi:hypothetical protein